MLDEGFYTSVSEIGEIENISKSYVSRILRLALLAPDVVESILAGKTDPALMLEHLERPLPSSWAEQRGHLAGEPREMGPSPIPSVALPRHTAAFMTAVLNQNDSMR